MSKKGFTIWLTGLPCSGKSTLANALLGRFQSAGRDVELLDGDVVRTHLCQELGFSRQDRDTNVRRVGYVCDLLSRHGVVAIAACISPYRTIRDEVRSAMGHRFVEVHVDTPLQTCMERDVKGMYAKALRREITSFTGVDDPYEPPQHPEITVKTAGQSVEASVETIVHGLRALGHSA